jgi:hypothetical protein
MRMVLQRRAFWLLLVTVAVMTACGDDAAPGACEVTEHEAQPVDEPAQYLDFVLIRAAPDADGRKARLITWDQEGAVLGDGETVVDAGELRIELVEGYERFSYQRFTVFVDMDGDGDCGFRDVLYQEITNAWNPVDNDAYLDDRPWFGEPGSPPEDCAALVACVPPSP